MGRLAPMLLVFRGRMCKIRQFFHKCFVQSKNWSLGSSGSRQDFREFAMPDETLGEFRYPKIKL